MRKLLLIILMLLSFSMMFAGRKNPYEITEKRIEKHMEFKYRDSKLEYDIDIYGEEANVKIEGRESALMKIGLENLAVEIADVLKTEANIKSVHVIIEEDKFIGEDEIIFSRTYN